MPWTLYLLYHKAGNRTYLGVTTNVERRLRQHRGELVGGARFTSRIQAAFPEGEWTLVATLNPFPNQSEVTRWERLLKLKTRGLKQRLDAMKAIADGKYPKEFSKQMISKYKVPEALMMTSFS